MCTYQVVKNVSFLKNFLYVLNEWPPRWSGSFEWYTSLWKYKPARLTELESKNSQQTANMDLVDYSMECRNENEPAHLISNQVNSLLFYDWPQEIISHE